MVCYDGSPFHPGPSVLYGVAERYRLTTLGVSAKFIDACRKTDGLSPVDTHDLSALRTVCSTGSPLHADGFEWVHRHVKPDVHLASISGGMDVDVFDEQGRSCPPGVDGELDDDLRSTIRSAVRSGCSPRHVPAVIAP